MCPHNLHPLPIPRQLSLLSDFEPAVSNWQCYPWHFTIGCPPDSDAYFKNKKKKKENTPVHLHMGAGAESLGHNLCQGMPLALGPDLPPMTSWGHHLCPPH